MGKIYGTQSFFSAQQSIQRPWSQKGIPSRSDIGVISGNLVPQAKFDRVRLYWALG